MRQPLGDEKMNLDPKKIPQELICLIPYAERWGIGDDCYRDDFVYDAGIDELEDFVYHVNMINDEVLEQWLCGPEADDPEHLSTEYVTFTCMFMAYDSAKFVLNKRKLII